MVNNEIRDKQNQVVEDYAKTEPITYSQFVSWVQHFSDEEFMIKQGEAIAQLDEDLFTKERINHLSFDDEIPEELTGEKYLQIYKKIWATIRHDLWKDIQARKKELRVQELPEEEFNKLYNTSHDNFETIRTETYSKIMDDPDITMPNAR